MWYVYVLQSAERQFRYIGSTSNVWRRLREHNEGLCQSTKAYRPFILLTFVAMRTEKEARALEQYFKTGSGKAVLYKRFLSADA